MWHCNAGSVGWECFVGENIRNNPTSIQNFFKGSIEPSKDVQLEVSLLFLMAVIPKASAFLKGYETVSPYHMQPQVS